MISEAPVRARLGPTEEARQAYWRHWLDEPISERELTVLHQSVISGRPHGAEGWVQRIARKLQLKLATPSRGRPRERKK